MAGKRLELGASAASPEKVTTGALVLGVFADGTLAPPAQAVDKASNGRLSAVMKLGDLHERAGSSLWLYGVPQTTAQRVLLVSLGRREQFGDEAFRNAIAGASRALEDCAAEDAAVTLTDIQLPARSLEWRLQHATRVLVDGMYRFTYPRAERDAKKERRRGPRRISVLVGG